MDAVFYLSRTAYNQIIAQASDGFPSEICGFLAGTAENYGTEIRPAKNVSSQPQVAYDIAPEETLAALLQFESKKLKLTGVYHSHPRYPATPSQTDLRLAAMPNACYLILSVNDAPNSDLRFELRGYRIESPKKFYEVQVNLVD